MKYNKYKNKIQNLFEQEEKNESKQDSIIDAYKGAFSDWNDKLIKPVVNTTVGAAKTAYDKTINYPGGFWGAAHDTLTSKPAKATIGVAATGFKKAADAGVDATKYIGKEVGGTLLGNSYRKRPDDYVENELKKYAEDRMQQYKKDPETINAPYTPSEEKSWLQKAKDFIGMGREKVDETISSAAENYLKNKTEDTVNNQ